MSKPRYRYNQRTGECVELYTWQTSPVYMTPKYVDPLEIARLTIVHNQYEQSAFEKFTNRFLR